MAGRKEAGEAAAPGLSRSSQVQYVFKLLAKMGDDAAVRLRLRIKGGKGMVVKGFSFEPSALEEALDQWSGRRSPPAAAESPRSGSRHHGETPQRRRKSTPAAPVDENMDPQACSALGRAPKDKAERRASGAREREEALPKKRQRKGEAPRDLQPEAAPAPPVPAPRTSASPPAPAGTAPRACAESLRSVKELKSLLAECRVDASSCVEKADLQALWENFELLLSRPLGELRGRCIASGGPAGGSVEECARFLAVPPKAGPAGSAGLTAADSLADETAAGRSHAEDAAAREQDAMNEVRRIQVLKKDRFSTACDWGFAVLDVSSREVAAVQRAYRALMRKLHPDKVGLSNTVTDAVKLIREAKELCERSLSRQEPPGPPRCLRSSTLCSTAGRRRFELKWLAPEERESAPVRGYIVAAVDPAYGRALTITALEPDYSNELHRFVNVEELTSYILAEEELQKMPRLWQQASASVQVAAVNDAGQSPWAVLRVPLSAWVPEMPSVDASLRSPRKSSAWSAPGRGDPSDDTFGAEVRRRSGAELRAWLEKQKKAALLAWLRTVHWSHLGGTKEELVERVALAAGRGLA